MDELILYRGIADNKVVNDLTAPEPTKNAWMAMSELVELCDNYGLFGNLWHCYLTFLLVMDENRFSLAYEMRDVPDSGITGLAEMDFKKIWGMFKTSIDCLPDTVLSYTPSNGERIVDVEVSTRLSELAKELATADTPSVFGESLCRYYKNYGVGEFSLYGAFRVGETCLEPIKNIDKIRFDDLVGYDIAKNKLRRNTKAFLEGRPANNCLLFGGAGTGKSSSVKALLNEYSGRGLRIIELQKHRLRHLNDLIATVRVRRYRFIVFMDDLSFEDFEVDYKYLKAVIEGGLEKKPSNMLIYATSNRRHIIKEEFADRDSLHGGDTVQEKLSLAARFGESIFFDTPDRAQYTEMVKTLARREGISMTDEELTLAANRWEMSHHGKSGRSARQLVDHLLAHQSQIL